MKKKIVVVDDEIDLLKVELLRLEKEGYEVVTETDGARAFETLKKTKPDLAILDLQLPNASGFEIFDRMQSDSALSKVPVIFASADPNVGRVEISSQREAVGYLLKPFNWLAMKNEIRKHLS